MSLIKQNWSLNRIIHTRISYFDGYPNFPHLNFPTTNSQICGPSPSPTFQNKSRRQTQSVVTNFLSCKPSSVQVKSPQATFTNYRKQNFSLLDQTLTLDQPSIIMYSTSTLQKTQTKRHITSIQISILHKRSHR